MNPKQPHDKFFKETFSRKEVVRDYIDQFLPKDIRQNLDLRTLQLSETSHIDEELQEHLSDIVYYCRWKRKANVRISLLFEHKSYPEKYPHLQLLRYLLGTWEYDLREEQPLTVTIPIIVYHGKKKWNYKPFPSYFPIPKTEKGSPLNRYIPKFDYHLTDLSHYTDEQLLALKMGYLVNTLLALKHRRDEAYIKKHFERIFIHAEYYWVTEQGRNFLKIVVVYILQTTDLSRNEVEDLVKKLPKPLNDLTMSTYDRILLEGKREGVKIGEKKGRITEKRAMIIRVLRKYPKWSNEEISELAEAPVDFVEKTRQELKK